MQDDTYERALTERLQNILRPLEERLGGLEVKFNDLSNAIEGLQEKLGQIEVMEFQKQVSSLRDELKELRGRLIGTERAIATLELDFMRNSLEDWVRQAKGMDDPVTKETREYLLRSFEYAAASIKFSDDPLKASFDVQVRWESYFKERGLSAFLEQ
ncbi:MAG: hypothetical protein HYX97_02775 [Chloroflexi bacterium]|nr:hypothetical protein [Chloroflexota bacterium]